MTVDRAGRTPELTSGTRCAPGGQEAAILPSVPGEFQPSSGADLRPLVDSSEGVADTRIPSRTEGGRSAETEDSKGCGLWGPLPELESGPRGGSQPGTAQTPQDLTRLSTLLEVGRASGHVGVSWCPSLLFLSFLGGETSDFYETPPGRGSVGPLYSPCHISVPVGIKKRTKPQNWGYVWFIFWEVGGQRAFLDPGNPQEQQEIHALVTLGNDRKHAGQLRSRQRPPLH